MNNYDSAQPLVQVRTDMYKNFRNYSVVGKALVETLNEMVLNSEIKKSVAYNLLQQFDYHMIKYIRIGRGTRTMPEDDRASVIFEAKQLVSYRHHPSDSGNGQLWQFLLKNVTVNQEFKPNVLQSFVNFCKYERGDNFSPTRVQLLKQKRKEEKLLAKQNMARGRTKKNLESKKTCQNVASSVEKKSEIKSCLSISVERNIPYVLIFAYSPFYHRPVTRLSDSDLVMHHGWWCKPLAVDINTNPRLEFVEFKREERGKQVPTKNPESENCRSEKSADKETKDVPHRVRSSNMFKLNFEDKHRKSYDPQSAAKRLGAFARLENQKFCFGEAKIVKGDTCEENKDGVSNKHNTRRSKKKYINTSTNSSEKEAVIESRTSKVLNKILQKHPPKQETLNCKIIPSLESKSSNLSHTAKIRMNRPQKLAPPKTPCKNQNS